MADGIMDRIETINNIPLCDKEARTLLEGKANIDHTHDNYATKTELNLKADVIHTHSDYVLKSDLTNILNRLTTLENKYTEILTRLNNIDTRLDGLEGGVTHPSVMYPITYEITEGITLSNTSTSINAGNRYVNTITYADGYTRDSIQIVMGGVDITNSITIHSPGPSQQGFAIEEVTGNLVIRIKAIKEVVSIPCTSISLYTDTIKLYEINSTATNIASVLPANTTDVVRWESSNPAVATVRSDKGVITAVSEGQCIVTAYCGSQKASCTVTVDIEESYNIRYYLTGATSSNNQQTINEKEAYYSVITLTNNKYSISSAKLTINGVAKNQYLTVTDRVIVDIPTGVVNGDIVITVETEEILILCTGISVSDITVAVNTSTPALYVCSPINCNEKLYVESLTFMNTSIAKKEGIANVEGVSPGTTTATLTMRGSVSGQTFSDTFNVHVTGPCTSLTCWNEVAMKVGSDTPLGVQIQPSNCTDKLYWEISDPSALSVYKTTGATNEGSGNIYAHAVTPGSYVVTFYCGEKMAKTTVVISATTIKCTNIAFNVPSIRVSANEGSWDCAQYLILTPSNTTDPVEWYTDTTDYFYITDNGTISFNKVGTYKVQARCNGKSATLEVIIN